MVVNNPNNWHWVDKNCIDWSREYFSERLANLSGIEDGKKVIIDSISSVEGDVEVIQRKGKVMSLFDLRLVFNILGTCDGEDSDFKGSITVPELAYDTTADEIQFDISIYNENSQAQAMRPFIKQALLPKIRDILGKFGHDLIVTQSCDIQISADKVNSELTKGNQARTTGQATTNNNKVVEKTTTLKTTPATATATASATALAGPSSTTPKYNTLTLHLEPVFNTTIDQLYLTLLDGNRIAAWSRSAPKIELFPPSEGSEFQIFGGSILGKLIKLVPNQRIVQTWRLDDWKAGHYSTLDIELIQGSSDSKMVVKWSGIPIGEEERVRNNFEEYYVKSIKLTFGFGVTF
ncbi:uncharacterized protein KQ657_002681 [Scheffersomyces spartinae]|uniref:Activator of Hsp90 ATPase AHSA1-like N-terminal domain-containing protein n=1 Tax=Scheffersomyces spartinae TaxID=45513 RepID=A0A9P8AH89_9ASCO|nr:uncharacterized protein KQ657_002681 [Scheffersomyces spartinae]KAG7191892.1 hypothetical protein KQ657_002681 [Scheffersomyces spartinae]